MSLAYYQDVIHKMDKVHEKVKYLLETFPELREYKNKQFVFAYWQFEFGFGIDSVLDSSMYGQLTDPETIRRCKQKVCESNPQFRAKERRYQDIKENAITDWVLGGESRW